MYWYFRLKFADYVNVRVLHVSQPIIMFLVVELIHWVVSGLT
jgi:hypothetical protein